MPLDPDLTEFTTASQVVATFSFQEIASGSGIIEFFCYTANDDDTPTQVNKITDQSSILSNSTSTGTGGTRSTGFTLLKTVTFDSSIFNASRQAEGTATVNITVGADGAGGNSGTARADVSLYHFDGTTQTQLGETVRGEEVSGVASIIYKTSCLVFTIPKTVFKIGDIIRLKVEMYVKTSNGSSDGKGHFLHDPANRTVSGADTAQLSLKLPFRILE